MTNKVFVTLLLACACLALAGCSAPIAKTTPPTTAEIAPPELNKSFASVYEFFNSIVRMGPVIAAETKTADGKTYQLVLNGGYLLDENTPDAAKRITLAPLGLQVVKMLPADIKLQVDAPLDKAFVKLATLLKLSNVGPCLTEPLLDQLNQRVTQYCTNLGFAYSINSPDKSPYLLPYGAMVCPGCKTHLQGQSIVSGGEILGVYKLNRLLNGVGSFDGILTNPTMINGQWVQVHVGVVLTYNPTTGVLKALPIVRDVEQDLITYTPPTHTRSENLPGFVFREISNGLGYMIPELFDTYRINRGGETLSGEPTTELLQDAKTGDDYQCFENYCLVYYRKTNTVGFYPLGQKYLKKYNIPEAVVFTPQAVSMVVSELHPVLELDKRQTITLIVKGKTTEQPIANLEAFLLLMLPDGKQESYYLPPTDRGGKAVIVLPQFENVVKGKAIPYVVCLDLNLEDKTNFLCVSDTFMFSLY